MVIIEFYIANLVYIFGNTIIRIIKWGLFGSGFPVNPQNVLIFRTGHLGDTFCAIPAMKAVKKRFPNTRFIFITAKQTPNLPHPIDVLKEVIEFDEIFTYEPISLKNLRGLSKLISYLRDRKPDLLIYLGQNSSSLFTLIRDMFFFRVAGCRSVCGFQWTKHRLFPLAQRRYRVFDKEVERLMKLVEPSGVHCEISWDIPRVPLNFNWPQFLNSRPIIAVHPTAKFRVKHWPFERFLEVISILHERYNAFFIVVGGNEAKAEAEALVEKFGVDALNLAGKTTFLQLAEVLRRCNLLISCDSGPIHVAAAVGTPAVGIYTARDYPGCWYPWGEQHIILRKDLPCQICLKTECETMDCIKGISADEVLKACGVVLERPRTYVKVK